MGALESDKRIVLTLDAGGTNFRFCAMRGLQPVTPTTALPSCADDLDRCLNNIIEGFERVRRQCARRYSSYNPRTDTYRSRHGQWKRCRL